MIAEIETLKLKLETYTEVLLRELELVPDDRLHWKPFDYFRSLAEQFYHVMQAENFYMEGITEIKWDYQSAFKFPAEPLTREVIRDSVSRTRKRTIDRLDKMTEEDLNRIVEIPYNPTRYSVRLLLLSSPLVEHSCPCPWRLRHHLTRFVTLGLGLRLIIDRKA